MAGCRVQSWQVCKMVVTRGDKHAFLVMKFWIPGDGTVQINMKEYIMEAIKAFNQHLTRSAATPAMKGLLTVDDQSKPLSVEKMEHFVSVDMKLLLVAKHDRPDMELTT